ncbi:MAG: hypothetical protein M1818_008361 [Claussenomyces sp. TS43310]|nr:MAG: hypothetical protein M1818_008361 [Claussenomyces sp. TS43310]
MSDSPAPPRGSGLSLYANLLDPSSSDAASAASISRSPVVFKPNLDSTPEDNASATKKQQINAAALRFQPTKRPQLSSQKPKPKGTLPKPATTTSAPTASTTSLPSQAVRPTAKSTLADWTAVGDDDDFHGGGEKRQRGGRKRRKKNREEYAVVQDWDDIYDPSRPNNYEEYKHGDEKIREIREWKDRLYAHRLARKYISDSESDEEMVRPQMGNQFAPPSNYSFAPPPIDPAPTVGSGDDKTGDDAYARRLQLSQAPPPPPPANIPPPPESTPEGVISRAPVRYSLPPAPAELPRSEAELEDALAAEEEDNEQPPEEASTAPRSLRPGQKGFAERLMSKYGWTKGSGLGADGTGIVNPLRVQIEKRKKKPDSEGGGFADPKGIGKIVGGKKKPGKEEKGKFGDMSEVIVLNGMLDGMDIDEEVGDGGLMQEIGEECGEKYGRVERVFVDRGGRDSAKVFVKFTNQLSALRAVNALEGRVFNGNTISAMFFETEKFEQGKYD